MFINCTRLAVNTWQLYCNSCGQPMDVVDSMELSGLMVYNEGALCMDCDPITADEIAPQLWFKEQPYFLILEGSICVVDWPNCAAGLRDRVLHLRKEIEKILDHHRQLTRDFSPFEETK